jgi:hypothetical protein
VIRAREELAGARTGLINHVRGVIKSNGERLPKCAGAVFLEKVGAAMLMMQINGVGALTAMAFLLTLDDPHQFKESRTVGGGRCTNRCGDARKSRRHPRRLDRPMRRKGACGCEGRSLNLGTSRPAREVS